VDDGGGGVKGLGGALAEARVGDLHPASEGAADAGTSGRAEPTASPVTSWASRFAGLRHALERCALAAALFGALSFALFLALGREPVPLFAALWDGSLGSGFALSETLVKLSPVLLCALATALPATLGLISVGAEGQLVAGSIAGTALVLGAGDRLGAATVPAMLLAAALGGSAYAALAAALRVSLRVNETISTLLLNYLPPLLVEYLVYGPWKDPDSLGWPATAPFPEAARLATYFDTRVHAGLAIGAVLVVLALLLTTFTRYGLQLALLRESPLLAERAGLSFRSAVLVMMALGGAAAGIAGSVEVSVIEGRLQPGIGAGAGYAGFLVAFLARGHLGRLLPLAFLVAALGAAGDNLQLAAGLPSAVVYVLQGLLFIAALSAGHQRASGAGGELG
jgi:simple sugar transport system permease protein